jgi:hypothetical protein
MKNDVIGKAVRDVANGRAEERTRRQEQKL